jgi:hypothetical protein
MRFEGQPVWVGLVNRELTPQKRSFKNQKLDLDEVRAFLLQNLWYAQGIAKYAFVRGAGTSPILRPKKGAGGIHYLTDGYRLVLWISQKSIPLNEVVPMDWETPPER